MKVLVLGNAQRQGVAEEVDRRLPLLREHCEVVLVDLRQEKQLGAVEADLALVFGGDGAILRAARQMGYRQIPVLGINLGRLGFLADIHPEELPSCLLQVIQGRYRVTRHLMFECVIEEESADSKARIVLGLNEAVVHTTPPFHMLDLELEVDGDAVAHFSGDGLIVSSPVGSTAHNLSAGGPILGQELSAFVITPICAHTLTYRPLVESADRVLTIALVKGGDNAVVIVDGQETIALRNRQRILLRRAPVTFGLVKVTGKSFFRTLRDKLHWGTPPRYRGEP